MWEKERYHNDEEFRLRRICQMRKYQSTKKGKKSMKKARKNFIKSGYPKKWKRKNPDYYSVYMKERRLCAKEQGICVRCFSRDARKGYVMCVECGGYFKIFDTTLEQDLISCFSKRCIKVKSVCVKKGATVYVIKVLR